MSHRSIRQPEMNSRANTARRNLRSSTRPNSAMPESVPAISAGIAKANSEEFAIDRSRAQRQHRHGEDLHQQNERLHHRALALLRDAAQVAPDDRQRAGIAVSPPIEAAAEADDGIRRRSADGRARRLSAGRRNMNSA